MCSQGTPSWKDFTCMITPVSLASPRRVGIDWLTPNFTDAETQGQSCSKICSKTTGVFWFQGPCSSRGPTLPWSVPVMVRRRQALHEEKRGRKEGKSALGPTLPGFRNTLNYVLVAHDFVLSILCHEHGDADCTSVCLHVSGVLLSLLSELWQRPPNNSLDLRNTEILFF